MLTLTYLVRIFSLTLIVFPILSYASDSAPVYKISNRNTKQFLEICTAVGCIKKNLPDTDTAGHLIEYPFFKLHDIDSDGIPELIATQQTMNGTAYRISALFRINNIGEFDLIKNNYKRNYMYNVAFLNGKVISSYHSAGNGYNDVYNYVNGKLEIELRDKNNRERTVFDKNGKESDIFLLKYDSDKKWFEKEIATARIKLHKAVLYNSPSFENASKMHLVENDTVALKKYHLNENKILEFYLVEYTTEKNNKIIKWIKKEALSNTH
ncbi:MAG: hypothetical protein LBE22_06465 [Azoarcus sp.]|jgi:hypothetical protein|nr:hypothetical protein [Azoarcus sp.]